MSGSRKRCADPGWKQRERKIAEFHGLKRNPLSGRNSGRVGDAYDPNNMQPWVFIEAKHYKAHAAITLFRKHREDVVRVDKKGLCAVALCEKGRPGFYMLLKSDGILEYAKNILEIYGYTVTKGE